MSKEIIIKLPELKQSVSINKEWIEQRDKLVKQANDISKITNKQTMENGGLVLKQITKNSNSLEKMRKDFSKPFRDAQKIIKKASDTAREPLERAKSELQKKLSDFAEAEAKRQAEIEHQRELERQKAIEEQAQKQAEESELWGEDAEEAPEVFEPEDFAPEVENNAKSEFTRTVTTLSYELLSEEDVPEVFKTVDSKKVNNYIKENKERILQALEDGKQLISGIKLIKETKVTSR